MIGESFQDDLVELVACVEDITVVSARDVRVGVNRSCTYVVTGDADVACCHRRYGSHTGGTGADCGCQRV